MPVDRHKAVLTNARNKTRAEVEQQIRAEYAWTQKFDRQRAEHGLGLMESLSGPQGEVVLRILAQQMGLDLVKPQSAAPPEPQGPPPADVKLDDGSAFFSATVQEQREQWLMAQFDKKIAALEQRYQPLIHERHMSTLRAEAATEAGHTLTECRAQWPQFGALEGDIKRLMTDDPKLSLERAYIRAFAAKGLPSLQQQHDTDRASQLHRKAAASAAPPSAPRAVTPLRDRDRTSTDIAREEFARLGG